MFLGTGITLPGRADLNQSVNRTVLTTAQVSSYPIRTVHVIMFGLVLKTHDNLNT
jgi:hypothetical protein